MRDDAKLLALKQSIDRLVSLLEQEAGIIARSEPSPRLDRLLAQVERLTSALETIARTTETQTETEFRELVDRPVVDQEDRNTRSDVPPDDDDAARV
jgi:hypothetical protein